MCFISPVSHTTMTEIERCLNFIKGAAPCLVESKYKGQVQLMLKYIENGDLRRWSLPGIRVFNIGLSEWRSRFNCISNSCMYKQA